MAVAGTETIGIDVGAADGSAGGIAAAGFVAGVDRKGAAVQSPIFAKPKRFAPSGLHSPALSQPVETPPAGPQWVHEIKLDGFRMAARVEDDE
jgi:ATP-dependent DNA ligase